MATVTKKTTTTTTRVAGKGRKGKPADDDGAPDLAEILHKLGAEATNVALWRVESDGDAYLGRVAVADFSLDYVLATHGGGKFRARVVGPNNTWVKGSGATFTVAGKPKAPPATSAVESTTSGGGVPNWATALLVATVPAAVTALINVLGKPKEADPVLLALIAQKRGDAPLDPLALVGLINDARREARDESRDLLASLPKGPSEGAGWPDVVRESLPPILEALNNATRDDRRARRATATVAAGAAAGDPTVKPAETKVAGAIEPKWITRVRPFVRSHILKWADAGKSPEVKADNVLDDLDDASAEDLGAHSQSPTFVADVFAALPDLAATPERREWFTVFLNRLTEAFAPDDADESSGVVAPAAVAAGEKKESVTNG